MTPEQVKKEFKNAEALLEGHFILSSGLHARQYLQCARVLMDTRRAAALATALADKIRTSVGDGGIDAVAAPAMGGLIIGHEVARALQVQSMFLERVDKKFQLRRGFSCENKRVVMIEDIVTTGLSSREAIKAIREHGGEVVAAGCIIDRSNGEADVGVALSSLAQLNIETFPADKIPADLQNIAAVKPGSRDLKGAK